MPPVLALAVALGVVVFGVAIILAADHGPLPMLVVAGGAAGGVAAMARPALAPVLVLALFPVAEVDLPGPLPFQLLDLAVIAVVAIVVLHRLALGRAPLPWVPTAWWALGLLLVVAAGWLGAVDPAAATKQLLLLGAGALFATTVVGALGDRRDLRLFVTAMVAVGAGVSLLALPSLGDLQSRYDGAAIDNRARSIFADPNELGCFAAVTLVLACGLLLSSPGRGGRLLGGLAMASGSLALVLSLSRGAWFGAALGVAGLAVLVPSARRWLAVTLVGGLLALAVGLLFLPGNDQTAVISDRVTTISDPFGNPEDTRPDIWRTAVRLIREHPLLGVGPGGFTLAAARASPQHGGEVVHAHSILLTVAAEAGVVAAALLVAFAVSLGRVVVRTVGHLRDRGDPDAALVGAGGAALLVYAGQGLLDYTLRNATLLILAWAIVGAVLAGARQTDRAQL